jgi:uncharacterized protein (TIGR03437 family)
LAPALVVSPITINLLAAQGSNEPPPTAPISITSTLTGTVGFTVSWSGASWLSASPSKGQAPATVNVFANPAGLAVGTYTGTVTVTPSNGSNPISVAVTLTITNSAPVIQSVTPPAIPVGAPDTQFTLTGSGFSSNSSVQVFREDGTIAQTVNLASSSYTALTFTLQSPLFLKDSLIQLRVKNPDSPEASNSIAIQVGNRFPTITSITNAASGSSGPIAPGEYVAINGSTLGPSLPLRLWIANGGFASTTLGTVQVTFDGVAAPLLAVSDRQVMVVAPFALAGKSTTQIALQYLGVNANTVGMQVAATQPALFTSDGSGVGQGLIFNDSGLSNTSFTPAAKGSLISIYFTGAGAMSPNAADGQIASAAGSGPVAPVSVFIDGAACEVISTGNAIGQITGMVQATVRVPSTARSGANVPIQMTVGGVASQAGVVLAIQ